MTQLSHPIAISLNSLKLKTSLMIEQAQPHKILKKITNIWRQNFLVSKSSTFDPLSQDHSFSSSISGLKQSLCLNISMWSAPLFWTPENIGSQTCFTGHPSYPKNYSWFLKFQCHPAKHILYKIRWPKLHSIKVLYNNTRLKK